MASSSCFGSRNDWRPSWLIPFQLEQSDFLGNQRHDLQNSLGGEYSRVALPDSVPESQMANGSGASFPEYSALWLCGDKAPSRIMMRKSSGWAFRI